MFHKVVKRYPGWGVSVIILALSPYMVFAQIGLSSASPETVMPRDWKMYLTYNQKNNIYFWKGNAIFEKPLGNGFIVLQNNFDINRIKTLYQDDKWKDTNQLHVQYILPLNNNVSSIITANSNYLSDLQSGFLNNITEHSVNIQAPVTMYQNIAVTPLLGFKWDKRTDTPDKGMRHGIDMTVYETKIGEYTTEAYMHYMSENLNMRRNNNHFIAVSLHRTFYKDTADTLQYAHNRQRRDYYVSLAGDLETRKETSQTVSNILTYNVFDQTKMRIKTEFSTGNVDISSMGVNDAITKRLRKDHTNNIEITLNTVKGRHTARVHFNYENAQQRYTSTTLADKVFGEVPFDTPDNNIKRIALGFSADGVPLRRHRYSLQGFIEKFQYDTPSKNNYDDRDEFRIWFKGGYTYNVNPRLSVTFNALANLDHLVYIFSQRSADNNWNRIFRAGSLVDYQSPSGIKVTGNFSVLANYVDYDFDDKFIQVRSFVFRKFSMHQTVSMPVTHKGRFETHVQLDLEENGLLQWEKFVQNILIERRILTGSIRYPYRMTPVLLLVPELSTFLRTETHHQTQAVHELRKQLSEINDIGISLEIVYQTSPSSQVTFNATKRFVKRGAVKENFQYVDVSINWLF